MKCKDCSYCWKEDYEDYSSCKWEPKAPDDIPPCEESEE